MNTSLYSVTVPVMKKSLTALSALLDKAAAHLAEEGKSEADLLNKRFAPDMFPFVRQVQLVSDHAKGLIARLGAKEAVSMEDSETSLAELKERLAKTIAYLDTVRPEDVDGREEAKVVLKYFPGKHLNGFHYAVEYALPNFFFHFTTAYDLLRNEGVTIGKGDFIGGLSLRDDA
jgi:hypothetical protein